jgi:hypothetical protein
MDACTGYVQLQLRMCLDSCEGVGLASACAFAASPHLTCFEVMIPPRCYETPGLPVAMEPALQEPFV